MRRNKKKTTKRKNNGSSKPDEKQSTNTAVNNGNTNTGKCNKNAKKTLDDSDGAALPVDADLKANEEASGKVVICRGMIMSKCFYTIKDDLGLSHSIQNSYFSILLLNLSSIDC